MERKEAIDSVVLAVIGNAQFGFARSREAFERALEEGGFVVVPKEPGPGVLMSMALRADHGLGCPGYYDQPMTATPGVTHARRLEVALEEARRQYEEVVGTGFYRPEREEEYRAMIAAAPSPGGAELFATFPKEAIPEIILVAKRIAAMSDRDWSVGAVLYLGIKPDIAKAIRQWAQHAEAPIGES